MASHKPQFTSDQQDMSRKLLDNLIDIVEDSYNEHQSLYAKRSLNHRRYSSEDEEDSASGSEESSDEGVTDREDKQGQTMEDLQNELTKLEINEETSTLETLILIVEFYVKSKDVEGFQKNVRRPDQFLLTKPRPTISDLQRMAANMEKQNLPFRAVMLHKAIATTFKYDYERHPENRQSRPDIITPDMAISGILQSIATVFDLRKHFANENEANLYLQHFIPIMYDMLTNLREIRHATRQFRADCEAWGLLFIALIHGIVNEAVEMHDVIKSGINIFEKRFKSKSQKHLIHGISHLTLAGAEALLRKNACESIDLGIKSLQESTEFTTWDTKVKLIGNVQDFANALKT